MFIANLFENYITEATPRLVVLYPGRFQPFHLGHREVFTALQSKFGRDSVFIATSNKTELPKSPFNFSDKLVFMTAAGVPADRILEVSNPYKLPEQFDPKSTIFVVAVGAPDKDRLRPDTVKKDGSPTWKWKTFCEVHRTVLRHETTEWMLSVGCENKSGYLGWICRDPLNSSLTIDHHDGDKLNTNKNNLKILCANCHQKKTKEFGDHKKRYSYTNQMFSKFFEEE